MKTILITGMSATGKSKIISDLSALGYHAVDLDHESFSEWVAIPANPEYPDDEVAPGKDWVWQEARVLELLQSHHSGLLFVSGCASNMSRFYPHFDHIVLLTASDDIIVARLCSRKGEAYGQKPEEMSRVLRLKQSIEPLLREDADLEIDTGIPNQSVTDILLHHINNSQV